MTLILLKFWNPFTWGDDIKNTLNGLMEALQLFISKILIDSTQSALEIVSSLFNGTINTLKTEVALTPSTFDVNLVDTLRKLSKNVMLPLAGVLLTYIFALKLYSMVNEKNRGNEIGFDRFLFLIIRTFIIIMLITKSFDIALAFGDLGKWVIDRSITTVSDEITTTSDITDQIVKQISPEIIKNGTNEKIPIESYTSLSAEEKKNYTIDFKLGKALIVTLISMVAIIATAVMVAIMYVVAWSRIIMLLLYATVAPFPMATLLNEDWIGTIGQNYLKNLSALVIQGFIIVTILVIYKGLANHATSLLAVDGDGVKSIILLLVTMVIVVKMLTQTHSISKSILGAQ